MPIPQRRSVESPRVGAERTASDNQIAQAEYLLSNSEKQLALAKNWDGVREICGSYLAQVEQQLDLYDQNVPAGVPFDAYIAGLLSKRRVLMLVRDTPETQAEVARSCKEFLAKAKKGT